MQFNIFKFVSILAVTLFLTSADSNARFITSDGVVYSYDIQTKTLQPASVVVSTRYFTTVRVKEITLADNVVSSTTEQVVSESTFLTSVPITTTNANNNNNNNVAELVTSSYSLLKDQIGFAASNPTTTTAVSIESTSTPTSSTTATIANTQIIAEASANPPENTDSKISKTNSPSSTTPVNPATTMASVTSKQNSAASITSSVNSDGTCYVYYEESDYYSTAYITEKGQSVDAASTITSTRTKTVIKTMTA